MPFTASAYRGPKQERSLLSHTFRQVFQQEFRFVEVMDYVDAEDYVELVHRLVVSVEDSDPVTGVGMEDESALIEDISCDSEAIGEAVEGDDFQVRAEASEPDRGQGISAADVEQGS